MPTKRTWTIEMEEIDQPEPIVAHVCLLFPPPLLLLLKVLLPVGKQQIGALPPLAGMFVYPLNCRPGKSLMHSVGFSCFDKSCCL